MCNAAGIYGCHNHTWFSEDSSCDPRKLCEAAVRAGLAGIAITDHFDTEFLDRRDQPGHILRSLAVTRQLQQEFAGEIRIFTGVEFGTAILRPEAARHMLEAAEFDVVIGSVHTVRRPGWIFPFSRIDFSPFSGEWIDGFLRQYFTDLQETVDTTEFDVLAHLTVPLRYIVGKYHQPVRLDRYRGQITAILRAAVAKDRALEVNTSGISGEFGVLMPERDIVQEYLSLGGRYITLASDAHVPEHAAAGLAEGAAMLRSLGVTHACYYQNRRPVQYPLPE